MVRGSLQARRLVPMVPKGRSVGPCRRARQACSSSPSGVDGGPSTQGHISSASRRQFAVAPSAASTAKRPRLMRCTMTNARRDVRVAHDVAVRAGRVEDPPDVLARELVVERRAPGPPAGTRRSARSSRRPPRPSHRRTRLQEPGVLDRGPERRRDRAAGRCCRSGARMRRDLGVVERGDEPEVEERHPTAGLEEVVAGVRVAVEQAGAGRGCRTRTGRSSPPRGPAPPGTRSRPRRSARPRPSSVVSTRVADELGGRTAGMWMNGWPA